MNIIDKMSEFGQVPKKVASTNGGEFASGCPVCGGKDRFRIWPEANNGEGGYWCRVCGKGGDAVQFLVDYCGMSFPDAFTEVGRDMPDRPSKVFSPAPASKPAFIPKTITHPDDVDVAKWQEHATKMVLWSHEKLLANQNQLAYLAGRGIDADTIRKFTLGFNPGETGNTAIYRPRESWGLPPVVVDGKSKRLWIPRGIVIPWFVDGALRRVRIRRMDEDLTPEFNSRYYILPGSAMMPVLINPARKAFVIVETELDGFLLDRFAGDLVGICALGTVGLKPDTPAFAAMGSSLRILNALDYDDAGTRARKWWDGNFTQAMRWPVPVGKDPGDSFQAGMDLRAWIVSGLPPACTIVDPGPMTTGPFSLVGKKGRGGVVNPTLEKAAPQETATKKEPVADSLPETISRLYGLLKRFPVTIKNERGRMGISWPKNWHAPEIKNEVSRLVYFDPACRGYVLDHPAPVITRENFIMERGM